MIFLFNLSVIIGVSPCVFKERFIFVFKERFISNFLNVPEVRNQFLMFLCLFISCVVGLAFFYIRFCSGNFHL